MTAAELIEILKNCPPGAMVMLAYDSMVCQYELEEGQMFIAHSPRIYKDDASRGDGSPRIYFCAMNPDVVQWHIDEAEKGDDSYISGTIKRIGRT